MEVILDAVTRNICVKSTGLGLGNRQAIYQCAHKDQVKTGTNKVKTRTRKDTTGARRDKTGKPGTKQGPAWSKQ